MSSTNDAVPAVDPRVLRPRRPRKCAVRFVRAHPAPKLLVALPPDSLASFCCPNPYPSRYPSRPQRVEAAFRRPCLGQRRARRPLPIQAGFLAATDSGSRSSLRAAIQGDQSAGAAAFQGVAAVTATGVNLNIANAIACAAVFGGNGRHTAVAAAIFGGNEMGHILPLRRRRGWTRTAECRGSRRRRRSS